MGLLRRPVLVKIMTIKLHYKSVLIPLRKILWTCCIFLSSLNNTFFSALVIIFRNMSYFCFNYTNTLFIHTMNYFSVVLRIIFLMWIKNYFLIGPRIIFQGIANLFFGLQCITGLSFEVDWSLTSLGDHFGNFASKGVLSKRIPRRNIVRERNERGFHLSYKICQELLVCRQWWGFWTEDLIEETKNGPQGLHESYTSGRKNVMSMREFFYPDPLAGFEKMAGFRNMSLPKNIMFPLITWKEQAICLQKLQAVVIALSLLNFSKNTS